MTRQSGPGMGSDGKLSPWESQYSGDASLWWCRGAGTGSSVVTATEHLLKMLLYGVTVCPLKSVYFFFTKRVRTLSTSYK